jgi:hypothetical protein
MAKAPTITVGELRDALNGLPDSHLLSFDGGLEFNGLKRWSETEHIVEFCEPQGHLGDAFKARNPHVKVVFIATDGVAWDAAGMIGSIDIAVR